MPVTAVLSFIWWLCVSGAILQTGRLTPGRLLFHLSLAPAFVLFGLWFETAGALQIYNNEIVCAHASAGYFVTECQHSFTVLAAQLPALQNQYRYLARLAGLAFLNSALLSWLKK